MPVLGNGTAYIEYEEGWYIAFFYSGGDTYRYGAHEDYDQLVSRLKGQGFTKIVDDFKPLSKHELRERRNNAIIDEFMADLEAEEARPKIKIKRKRGK